VGFLIATILTLSSAGRGWRALSAIGFFIGIATLIAAWKGMCVVSSSPSPFCTTIDIISGLARNAPPPSPALGIICFGGGV
jgi:hypothetical protein